MWAMHSLIDTRSFHFEKKSVAFASTKIQAVYHSIYTETQVTVYPPNILQNNKYIKETFGSKCNIFLVY